MVAVRRNYWTAFILGVQQQFKKHNSTPWSSKLGFFSYPQVIGVKSHHTADKTWWKKYGCFTKSNYRASCLPFYISPSPGLFEIVAQSADGTVKRFLWMYLDGVRKWVLGDFLHFRVFSSTEKGTRWAYQPNWAVLGLSTAWKSFNYQLPFHLLYQFCSMIPWSPVSIYICLLSVHICWNNFELTDYVVTFCKLPSPQFIQGANSLVCLPFLLEFLFDSLVCKKNCIENPVVVVKLGLMYILGKSKAQSKLGLRLLWVWLLLLLISESLQILRPTCLGSKQLVNCYTSNSFKYIFAAYLPIRVGFRYM